MQINRMQGFKKGFAICVLGVSVNENVKMLVYSSLGFFVWETCFSFYRK